MNRQFTTLIALCAGALIASGAQLTPEEALGRIYAQSGSHKVKVTGTPQLVYTADNGKTNQFYVFNNAGNQGYTIVSADDCVAPLLGYSDESFFDADNMPENMKAWLEGYQRQIEWAIANGVTVRNRAETGRADIAPLVKSRWSQEEPYNALCPSMSGSLCATGCVATAMAQIMYYHKWPEKGTGSNSYRWRNKTLSVNFANTTYDWANMTDRYNSSSTDIEKEAVANLMFSCGVSVNMNYGPSSGAQSTAPAYAFANFFNYDKGVSYYLRDYYSGSVWEQMVYNELAAGRPVMYDGLTARNEGHEFVCDGYRDGYFHINWGWGGMSDGYFMLAALDPGSQGTGGGSSGFNFSQGATMGIQKPAEGSEPYLYLAARKDFYTDKTVYSRNEIVTIRSREYVYLPSSYNIDARFGLQLTDSDGKIHYVFSPAEPDQIKGMITAITGIPIDLNRLPQSGTYTAKPAFYNEATGKWGDILIPINYSQGFTITIEGNTVTIIPIEYKPELNISDIKALTPLYNGIDFHITASATVKGDTEFFGNIKAALCPKDSKAIANFGDEMTIDVEPGRTFEIDYMSSFQRNISAGEYDLVFVDSKNNIVSERVPVTFKGSLDETTSIELVSFSPESKTMPMNQIKLNGTVKCTSGFFSGRMEVYLFAGNGGTSVAYWVSDPLWVSAGESADFTIEGEYLDGRTGLYTYTAIVLYDDAWMEPQASFRLSKATSGIDGVTDITASVTPNPTEGFVKVTSTATIDSIEFYSVAGALVLTVPGNGENVMTADVSALTPGHYVVVVRNADGVETHRIIKR